MSSYPSAKSSPPADGDQNHGTRMLIVIVTTFTIVVAILCLRLSVRLFVVRSMGWDDYSIIAATIAATICNAFNLNYIHSGGGRHSYYLGIQGEINASKWSTLAQLPFIIATTFTKVSICFMIVRITNSKSLIRFMWAMIGALIAINLMGFIVVAARCTPFEAGWNYYTIQGKCWPHKVLEVQSYLQGVFSIVTDFTCTMLPIIVLWNIQISVRQKIAICGLVAMGLFTTACSIARLYLYASVTSFLDTTWSLLVLQIWTVLEQNIGLIAASLPALLPLHKLLREKTRGSYSRIRALLSRTNRTESYGNSHSSKGHFKVASLDDMTLPLQEVSLQSAGRKTENHVKPNIKKNNHGDGGGLV